MVFDMDNGVWVIFNDLCCFGVMDLLEMVMVDVYKLLCDIGFEFLGNDFNEIYLVE